MALNSNQTVKLSITNRLNDIFSPHDLQGKFGEEIATEVLQSLTEGIFQELSTRSEMSSEMAIKISNWILSCYSGLDHDAQNAIINSHGINSMDFKGAFQDFYAASRDISRGKAVDNVKDTEYKPSGRFEPWLKNVPPALTLRDLEESPLSGFDNVWQSLKNNPRHVYLVLGFVGATLGAIYGGGYKLCKKIGGAIFSSKPAKSENSLEDIPLIKIKKNPNVQNSPYLHPGMSPNKINAIINDNNTQQDSVLTTPVGHYGKAVDQRDVSQNSTDNSKTPEVTGSHSISELN